jgi:hypothetical protein
MTVTSDSDTYNFNNYVQPAKEIQMKNPKAPRKMVKSGDTKGAGGPAAPAPAPAAAPAAAPAVVAGAVAGGEGTTTVLEKVVTDNAEALRAAEAQALKRAGETILAENAAAAATAAAAAAAAAASQAAQAAQAAQGTAPAVAAAATTMAVAPAATTAVASKVDAVKQALTGSKVRKGLNIAGTAMGWIGGLFAIGAGVYMVANRDSDKLDNPVSNRR